MAIAYPIKPHVFNFMGFFRNRENQPLLHDLRQPVMKKYSWLMAAFLLINTTIGAGLLNFPTSFYISGGIANTLLMQSWILVFIIISMHILMYLTHKSVSKFLATQSHTLNAKPPDSYEEIIACYCGLKFQILISLIIILYSFGTCITYLIVISDQLQKIVFFRWGTATYWFMDRNLDLLLVSFLAILPLCFSKSINLLYLPSALGTIAMLYLPFILMRYYYFPPPLLPPIPNPSHKLMQLYLAEKSQLKLFYGTFNSFKLSYTSVFQIVPTICFLYNSQLSITPTYHSMGRPHAKSVSQFSISIFINVVVCAIIYNITGIYGFLNFGDKVLTNTDILTAFDLVEIKIIFAMILIVGKIITTFPIVVYCARITVINTSKAIINACTANDDSLDCPSNDSQSFSFTANESDDTDPYGYADTRQISPTSPISNSQEGGDDRYYEPYISPDWIFLKRWFVVLYRALRDHMNVHDRAERYVRIGVTLIWFSITLTLTLYVPNIGKIIPFLGSLSLLLIFVFPATAFLVHVLHVKAKVKRLETLHSSLITNVALHNSQTRSSAKRKLTTSDLGKRKDFLLDNGDDADDDDSTIERPSTSHQQQHDRMTLGGQNFETSTPQTRHHVHHQHGRRRGEGGDGLPDLTFGRGYRNNFVKRHPHFLVGLSIFLIIFGIFLFGTVLTQAIIDVIES